MQDDNADAERIDLIAERNAILRSEHTFNPIVNVRDLYRGWNQPKPHPVTGDLIPPGERITWRVMGIYRRWTVFLLLQVLTVVWLSFPKYFPGGQFGWNLLWSDLAVMVEMIVGIAFMAQSMRDAKLIRTELAELQTDSALIREIHDALMPGKDGHITVHDGKLTLHSGSPGALPHDLQLARERGQPLEVRHRRHGGGHLRVGSRCATVAQA